MECERFDQMLYLYRRGELSDDEAAALTEHVKTCTRCAATQQRITQVDRYVESVRAISPTLEKPEELTARLMARIRGTSKTRDRTSLKDTINRLLDYFLLPPVRYASAAIVVIAMGSFSLQYFTILRSIGSLEQSMAISPLSKAKPTVSYSIEVEAIRSAADRDLLRAFGPYQDQVQSDGAVVVDAKTLKSLASFVDANASLLIRGYTDRDRVDALIHEVAKNARTLIRFVNGGD